MWPFFVQISVLPSKNEQNRNTGSDFFYLFAPFIFLGRTLFSGRLILVRHSPSDAAEGVVYGACHGGSRPSGSHLVEGVGRTETGNLPNVIDGHWGGILYPSSHNHGSGK